MTEREFLKDQMDIMGISIEHADEIGIYAKRCDCGGKLCPGFMLHSHGIEAFLSSSKKYDRSVGLDGTEMDSVITGVD